jgi:hypothetical protein
MIEIKMSSSNQAKELDPGGGAGNQSKLFDRQ